MGARATASFSRDTFLYAAAASTANGGSETAPTNTSLLLTSAPDGSDIWGLSALANATGGSANRVDTFVSPDGGTTFQLLPFRALLAAFTLSATADLVPANMAAPNTIPLGPTNPFVLGGKPDLQNLIMAQSVQSDNPLYFRGGESEGSANAHTLPYCVNSAGTELGASPAYGSIVDFVCGQGLPNTTTTTIAPGLQAATPLRRKSGTELSANDLFAGMKYRMWFDATFWRLVMTPRLYIAISQSQGVTAQVWGAHR